MEFEKYNSIKNHYDTSNLSKWERRYGSLDDVMFEITEKIDGANFSVTIDKDGHKFGRRGAFLGDDEKFFNYKTAITEDIINLVESFKKEIGDNTITLYGELFGPGVQRRIEYGAKVAILFFEAKVNNEYIAPAEFLRLLKKYNAADLYVPVLGLEKGLMNAVNYVVDGLDTALFESGKHTTSTKAANAEGIVIKPAVKTITNSEARLVIKKKSDAFSEIRSKKLFRVPVELSHSQEEILTYVTENRLASVISKEGEIEGVKDISKYIKLLCNDALSEYIELHSVTDAKENKLLKKVLGGVASRLVRNHIVNGEK